MPEGPEIETIRRTLNAQLPGRTIQRVEVITPRQISYPDPESFVQILQGSRFGETRRRGKYLLLQADGRPLVCHLRMSGRLVVLATSAPLEKHTHVIFHLDDGLDLRYIDQRRFGGFHLPGKEGRGEPPGLANLGPDALEELTSLQVLRDALRGRRGNIKALLLNQSVLAGIGNIYADEILYRATIHPLRAVDSLGDAELSTLYEAICAVLSLAVHRRGTTFSLYRDAEGREGDMYSELQVFDQTDRPCGRCGTAIRKIAVAGRGTHICPQCQTPPQNTVARSMRARPGKGLLWPDQVGG